MTWLAPYEGLTKLQKEIVAKAEARIANTQGEYGLVVKGPAGTGKTLVLAHIALRSTENTGFFFVYTNILLKFLRSALEESNRTFSSGSAGVDTFHTWLFRLYKAEFPFDNYPAAADYTDKVNQMIERLSGSIKGKIFDYILIDEAQDFRPNVIAFLRSISKVMVFVGDGNQAIYVGHKDDLTDLTDLLGTHDTEYLKLSIRISPSLINLLYPYMRRLEDYKSGIQYLKRDSETSPRKDSKPLWFRNVPLNDFISYLANTLAMSYINDGKNIALVCHHNEDVDDMYEKITREVDEEFVIRVTTVREQEVDFSKNKLYLLTMHSCKGLEFDNLVFLYVNSAPREGNRAKEEKKLYENLAYTVYTRPKEDLLIYSPGKDLPLKDKMNLDYITILETLDTIEDEEDLDEISGIF